MGVPTDAGCQALPEFGQRARWHLCNLKFMNIKSVAKRGLGCLMNFEQLFVCILLHRLDACFKGGIQLVLTQPRKFVQRVVVNAFERIWIQPSKLARRVVADNMMDPQGRCKRLRQD